MSQSQTEHTTTVRPNQGGRWMPTHAYMRAILVAGAGVLIALSAARPDALVLAAPFAAIVAWSVVSKPDVVPVARFRMARDVVTEGQQNNLVVETSYVDDAEAVITSVAPSPWMERRPEHGSRVVDPVVDAEWPEPDSQKPSLLKVATGTDPKRWGDHQVGPVMAGAVSPWAAYLWGPVHMSARRRRTLPSPEVFDTAAPAPHPRGLVGQHRSSRPGQGSEFNTIRGFQWGDKLKRIHWGSTSRTGQLHVTSSYADQDTHVAMLVDAQADIGGSGGLDGKSSSLDKAVRATAAISEHFARQGDRVSLQVISSYLPQRLPQGTGSKHARRVLDVLSGTTPSAERDVDFDRLRFGLPPGTLVVMVSALVSPAILTRAAALARSGLTVVVIDVLEEGMVPESVSSEEDKLAWRIRLLEREREIRKVQETGAPVVAWQGPGSLDIVLRLLSRRGRTGAM